MYSATLWTLPPQEIPVIPSSALRAIARGSTARSNRYGAALPTRPVKGEIVRNIFIGPYSRSGCVMYYFDPCQE